jgi:ADP-heptose:LPS heptosyltransferase
LASWPAFLADVQGERFDLAIQMHGCGTITNPLTGLFGARHCAGYFLPGQYCPDPEWFLPYPTTVPEVWRHLLLMEFLGVPFQGEDIDFPLGDEDRRELRGLDEADELRPDHYVCVHPGARGAFRRWPPERFASVADALADDGLRIVLTGSKAESGLTRSVREAMRAPALDLAGRTSLGSLGALLHDARLLLCNDTGLSHLAAALRVPSVVVFHQLSECEGWPPLDRVRHRVVCGISGIFPDMVLAQARDVFRTVRPRETPPRVSAHGNDSAASPASESPKEYRSSCAPCAS